MEIYCSFFNHLIIIFENLIDLIVNCQTEWKAKNLDVRVYFFQPWIKVFGVKNFPRSGKAGIKIDLENFLN